jgi:hypothetical protein
VTDPQSGHVYVLDAASESKIASIPVPGAYGLDDTPDHTLIYVGTQIGDVYVIDAASMVVTKRYMASQIGPYSFRAYSAQVMADGRVALLGGQGGIANVDGYSGFAVWDPVNNSIENYASSYGGGAAFWPFIPYKQVCGTLLNISGFARTPDRKRIVVGSMDSDSTLCVVDTATGADQYASTGAVFPVKFTQTPDGNSIIIASWGKAYIFDSHNLILKTQFSVAGDTSSASGIFVSADSKTLFVTSDSIVYAYDLSSQQQVGWLSNILVSANFFGSAFGVGPMAVYIQAVDGTGLLAGPLEEGVGFLDSAAMHTGPVGKGTVSSVLNPPTGPVAGGTSVSWAVPYSAVDSVYFGKQKAGVVSMPSQGMASATVPEGSAGVVDIYTFGSDGSLQVLPDAFSYGPTIVQVTPDTVTTVGLGSGFIFGYGFGPTNATSIPTDLSVSVGGQTVSISAFYGRAGGAASPSFPLQVIAYTIPFGVLGVFDVSVSTTNGTAVAHGAMTYIPAVQTFFRPGSSLAQGIYDPRRDLYYFTDATSIQVFSRTKGAFQSPIAISGAHRLWGIALSPDGSKLAIADAGADTIYVLDPANPASIKSFAGPTNSSGTDTEPRGVAVSDSGFVYFTVSVDGCSGCMGYYKLDTTSGKLTDYKISAPDLWSDGVQLDAFLRTIISADNARVYFNNDGEVFSIDTATDAVYYAFNPPGCCYGDYDLALSPSQTRFAATGDFFDADLNMESSINLNFREVNISYLYGMKLSSDGRLLFQPTSTGMDVLDARLGYLHRRIELGTILSTGYDALVSDGRDNVLLAITGLNASAVSVVDLTSISEPVPLPYDAAPSSPHPQFVHGTTPRNVTSATDVHRSTTAARENRSRPRHILNPTPARWW